jgi:hypothetical protein
VWKNCGRQKNSIITCRDLLRRPPERRRNSPSPNAGRWKTPHPGGPVNWEASAEQVTGTLTGCAESRETGTPGQHPAPGGRPTGGWPPSNRQPQPCGRGEAPPTHTWRGLIFFFPGRHGPAVTAWPRRAIPARRPQRARPGPLVRRSGVSRCPPARCPPARCPPACCAPPRRPGSTEQDLASPVCGPMCGHRGGQPPPAGDNTGVPVDFMWTGKES